MRARTVFFITVIVLVSLVVGATPAKADGPKPFSIGGKGSQGTSITLDWEASVVRLEWFDNCTFFSCWLPWSHRTNAVIPMTNAQLDSIASTFANYDKYNAVKPTKPTWSIPKADEYTVFYSPDNGLMIADTRRGKWGNEQLHVIWQSGSYW